MAAVAVLAPFADGEAIELGNHYWRKQVLRHGDFAYGDRTLQFTPAYTAQLARAYREKAYDAVPFQFAGSDNKHTNSIEATRGEIVGFESTADGLDAIFTLEPEAQKIVERHPKLPVSVRIVENLDRADGKHWDAAIQHVLATWDPRVTAMKPWERVDLADDVDHVLDLTDARSGATPQEGHAMPQLSENFTDEEIAKLRALLAGDTAAADQAAKDAKDAKGTDAKTDGYVAPSDEELERIAGLLFPDEKAADSKPAEAPAEAPAEVTAAATPSPQAIELASRLDRMEKENAALRRTADEAAYGKLRDDLARDSGIPPAVTDLGKELLTGAHTIELSGGETVDAGKIVHTMLTALGEQIKLLDLSGPVVFDQSALAAEAEAEKSRTSFAADYAKNHGLV
jgi:hypothetical protein